MNVDNKYKGMGGGLQRPPEFFAYKKLLEGAIKGGWHWNDVNAPLIAPTDANVPGRR